MKERIHQYFIEHRQEMLDDIMELVRIPSVNAPAEEGAPFGPACRQVLDAAVAKAKSFGFRAEVLGDKVAVADLNDCPAQLDILAHLDVVPAGDGWSVTEPFVPLMKDGRIYGRGTCDDKGPAIASLYAMRAVRELGIPLKHNARLILGADEETGSQDIDYYYSHYPEAPCSFSPDADYPIINVEKGGFFTTYSSTWEGEPPLPRVFSLDSGTVGNAVPGKAEAVIEGLDPAEISPVAEKVAAQTGTEVTVTGTKERAVITVVGTSAHASTPWEGCSSLTSLLTMLTLLPFAPSEGMKRLQGISKLFPHGDFYGNAAGIAQEDEISGKLTLTMNVLHYKLNELSGRVDCRAPVCANEKNALEPLRRKMAERGLELSPDCHMMLPHHVPEDGPLVQTLLQCYEEVMHEPGKCIAIGGGTYAHFLKNGVAFGAAALGTDYHMHGPDEYLIIDEMVRSAELFALAICRLCGEDAPRF